MDPATAAQRARCTTPSRIGRCSDDVWLGRNQGPRRVRGVWSVGQVPLGFRIEVRQGAALRTVRDEAQRRRAQADWRAPQEDGAPMRLLPLAALALACVVVLPAIAVV